MPESAIFQPSGFATEYRATGFVRGRFILKKQQSQLVTSEGVVLKAFCCKNLAQLFTRRPELLEQEYLWSTWLRTSKAGKVKLNLKHFLTSPKFPEEDLIRMEALCDHFSIRGQVAKINDNTFSIRIQRNSGATPAERKPFVLTISGTLPEEAKRGQFWELTCVRDHENLMLSDAKLIKPCRQPKSSKKKESKPKPKLKLKCP